MKLETVTLAADESHELTNMPGILTRVETTPAAGWMLDGTPVEEWASDCIRQSEAKSYLARKIAEAEGLNGHEAGERAIALEDEAVAWVTEAYAKAEARSL